MRVYVQPPYVPIVTKSAPRSGLEEAEGYSRRAYVHPPYVPTVAIKSAPGVGCCLRKPELRELRMKGGILKPSQPCTRGITKEARELLEVLIYSSMPFK